MQVNSTSDYKAKAFAAFAATCLVSTAAVHAETTTSFRGGIDQFRMSAGGSSDWQDAAGNGHVLFYVEDAVSVKPTYARQTTELEHLIASLRGMEHYSANWDGEGAKAPIVASLRAASDFACLLAQGIEIPEPLLHASGRAGLAWSADGSYGELEFFEDGSIAYYFAAGANKHKGLVTLETRSIPVALEVLLPKA